MTARSHKLLFTAPFNTIGAIGLLAGMVAGCAGPSGNFPSLSRRAIEAAPNVAGISTISTSVLGDEALSAFEARIANAETSAYQSEAEFNASLPRFRTTILSGHGKARDSDAWLEAELALSRLEQSRAGTQAAVADLDMIARELVVAGERRLNPRLDAAQTAVNAIAQAQQSEYTTLANLID